MLYNLIIAPIETIVDWVFTFFYRQFSFVGIFGAIVGVSLTINFLALPLYNIADSLQENERKLQKKLKKGIDRIKKTFKGDERFMILQTFYKQNHYHPVYALRSSLSILIEIPFFIAAYHYLSNCEILKEAVYTITPPLYKCIVINLSQPDHLFQINLLKHSFFINILPILMTVINIFSGAVYSKEVPVREKITIFGLPFIFLILLYNSPSGLVCYWIFNNIFSWIKNIVKSKRNSGKILYILIFSILVMINLSFWILKPDASNVKKMLFTIAVLFYAVFPCIMKKAGNKKIKISLPENFSLFIFSCIGLALLAGIYLPSSTISSDPIAFAYLGKTESPFFYVKNSFYIYSGFFIIWPLLIYKLFDKKIRVAETYIIFIIFICSLINSFALNFDYGTINILFNLDEDVLQSSYPLLNFISLFSFAIIVSFILLIPFIQKKLSALSVILVISLTALSVSDISKINHEFTEYKKNISAKTKDDINSDIKPVYNLSKTGKNVIVLFLDKACGAFFPYVQKEHPEIISNFKGFTYYPNTASFGGATLYGSPAMLGGYEYTPEGINEYPEKLLKEKHIEASLMMPLIFSDYNYSITITDPPLPSFSEGGDLSAYDDYPEFNVQELKEKYTERYRNEKSQNAEFDIFCKKGIVNFSMLQILFPAIRNTFYVVMKTKNTDADEFFKSFPSLYYIKELTGFSSSENTFTFIGNETPHFATYMNTENFEDVSFEKTNFQTEIVCNDESIIMNYQVYIASLNQLNKWFEFLQKNNCYNNSRIIIISDHGSSYDMETDFNDQKKISNEKILSFNPLFMVKDFGSDGKLKTDYSFMTNADTIFEATKNLNMELLNPFTKKKLVQDKMHGINCYYTFKGEHNPMPLKTKMTLTLKNGLQLKKSLFDANDIDRIN